MYEFEAYLEALLRRAAHVAQGAGDGDEGEGLGDGEGLGEGLPSAVYVASDSLETPDFVDDACADDSPFLAHWPAGVPPPCMFSADPAERFRTEHGSHTVAAGGGCHGNVCAMQWYDILKYQEDGTYTELSKVRRTPLPPHPPPHPRSVLVLLINPAPLCHPPSLAFLSCYGAPRGPLCPPVAPRVPPWPPVAPCGSQARRMMVSLYEAMEDLYLLSHVSFLVGTMSSHFSTQARQNPLTSLLHITPQAISPLCHVYCPRDAC